MIEPLPDDVDARLHKDFGNHAVKVKEQLLLKRGYGSSSFLGDRLIRCIIFAASGDELRIGKLIELAQQDYRDVIVAGEYDRQNIRKRDLNKPFEDAEFV